MKERGSALIISIFLITAIGSVAFGMGRLMFLEAVMASSYEKGIIAYYSAESGMEEAFLRYRYSNESEVPFTSWASGSNYVARSYLDQKMVQNDITINNPISQSAAYPQEQVYDLRMSARATSETVDSRAISDNNYGNGYGSDFVINRDESKKFVVDLASSVTNDVTVQFKPGNTPSGPNPLNNRRCLLVEAKIIGRINGSSRIEEKKKLFYNDSAACRNHYYTSRILSSEPWAASSSIQAPYMVINNNHYEITNIKNALWGSVQVADAELFIKPVGNGIEYKFVHSGIGTAYGPASVIRSHGYYMGVGRKLEARIDRQSGTLYDLFDYVIYQAD